MRYFEKRNLIIGSGSVTIGVIGHGINAGFILKEFINSFDEIIEDCLDCLEIYYSRGLKFGKQVRTLKKNVYETRVKESEDLKKLEYYKHQVKDQDFGYGKIGRFNKIDNNFFNFDAELNEQVELELEQDLKRHFFICINAKKINEKETLTELVSLTTKSGILNKKFIIDGENIELKVEAFNFGEGVSQAYVGYKYEMELNNEKFKEALFLGKKGINEGKKGLVELKKKIEKDESLINDIKTCGVIKEGIFFKYSDKINLDEINIVNIEK